MLLISHIIIALGSILATSITYMTPSPAMLRLSYAMIASTLLSGTLLVVTSPVHMLQVCISGLTYVALVTVGVLAARRKLALQKVQ
jgi:hypothetical protein